MKVKVNQLNQVTIREWFYYDSDTGKLLWRKRPGIRIKVRAGDEAGCIIKPKGKKAFYRRLKFQGKNYMVHDIVWVMHQGFIPVGFEPDHIDHNGLNNKISNLRLVTHVGNHHNMSKYKNNNSGITGIFYNSKKQKWQAQIGLNNKSVHLGYFEKIGEAIENRKIAERRYKFHENHGR
jgi:hypothetical protein